MNALTLTEYARSPRLTPDETYTVELLIERVRDEFDETYWEDWSERGDARRNSNYEPTFSPDHVAPAAEELSAVSWLSFQRLCDDERPVRDIAALRFLPRLSALVLINNLVSDLTSICSCPELRRLHLNENPIRDISPLAKCTNLEELHLGDCPIQDFSPLQVLPNLSELSISIDQIEAFKQVKRLPHLKKLEFGLEGFESFDGFPEMPELRVIRSADVEKLDGLQHFPKIQNLVNLSGQLDSLDQLRNLKGLTHANFISSQVKSLEPLANLHALCDLSISTDARKLDLSPLESIASLHELSIRCAGENPAGLDKLKTSLLPWDTKFRAAKPRHTPSLELHVVDQRAFEIYDTEKPFNVAPEENECLLSSELEWLDAQLETFLAADFRADNDYTIPIKWNGARSRTVVLYSDASVNAFSKIVLGIQDILSNAKQDWIIYLQSDDVDQEFIVWVYPGNIVATQEYAETVRSLINSTSGRTK